MNSGKVVLGMLAGLATGAVLGILFAPEKGSITRRKIARKGSESVDEVKDKLDELLSSLTDKFEEVKEDAMDLIEKGKMKMEDVKKGVRSEMN
jgi:gas vesicle protein